MSPFSFDGLVWPWPIAFYLFFAGISAGAIVFAILLKHFKLGKDAYKSGFIQAASLIAPIAVFMGLGILVVDLTKPFDFWKILVFYNPTSVMSVGVAVLMVYQVALFAWLGCTFKQPVLKLCAGRWPIVDKLFNLLSRQEATITGLLMILAIALGAYTGFLLSALITYPLLNNPVLPLLFLVSGLSSGAAGTLLGGVLLKGNPDGKEVHFIHNIEIPIILLEIVLIFTFFLGLMLSGGSSQIAALNAIGEGFWGWIFWGGVMFIGLAVPLTCNLVMKASHKRKFSYVALTACCSLIGVLMLRHFILYTGQMTVV